MMVTTTNYGLKSKHGLAPCKPCGIWHCPECGCPSVDDGQDDKYL